MRHALGTFCTVLICVVSTVAQGQGLWIEKGQNAMGVSAFFSSNDDASAFGLSAGTSISGILDFGVAVGRISPDIRGTDLKATGIVGDAAFYIVKETAQTPVNVVLTGFYTHISFSGDDLDALGWEVSGKAYGGGLSLSKTFPASPTVDIVPSIGASYTFANAEIQDSFGGSLEDDDENLSFGIAAGIGIENQSGGIFTITPGVTVGEDVTTIRISMGYIVAGRT